MADEPNPFDDYGGDTATLPPPGDTPPAPQGKAPDNAPNPFDAFQDESTDTLKEAPPPTPLDSFMENMKQAAGGITKQAVQTVSRNREQRTIREGNEKGIARPEEGFQTEKPTQSEYDTALGDLAVRDANRRRWDSFHSEGFWGKTAAFFGGAIGGILDPVNILPMGMAINAVRGLTVAAGAGPVLSNIAGHAGAFGLFTAGTDAASQGLDIQAGYQVGFDAQRTVMAGALGAGLGFTFSGIGTLIKGMKGELPHQAPAMLEGAAKDKEIARLAEEERMRAADEEAAGARPEMDVIRPQMPTDVPQVAAPPTASRETPALEPPRYQPGPEHGFEDTVKAEKTRLRDSYGAAQPRASRMNEESRFSAFQDEVGDILQAKVDEHGLDPDAVRYGDIWKFYERAPGQPPEEALEGAIGRWVTEEERRAIASTANDAQLQRDLDEWARAYDSERERMSTYSHEVDASTQMPSRFGGRQQANQTLPGVSTIFRDYRPAHLPEEDIPFEHGRPNAPEGGNLPTGGEAQPREAQGTDGGGAEPAVRGERGGRAAAGGEAPAAAPAPTDRGEKLGGPVETLGGKPFATERTAQGEQTVMPGAERESPEAVAARQRARDKEEAEARMRGRKGGGVPQESAEDLALFGGERQKDLLGSEPAPGEMFNKDALAQHEQFLRGRAALPQGPNAELRRRSNREQLPGEAETIVGPKQPVTDEEARNLKLNEQMKHITERLGRRLEFDGRFSVGGVLGTYKPAEGVLRARYAGDIEVWTHELGHAIDQKLGTDPQTSAVWSALRTAAPNELLPLDFNAVRSGGTPSIEEGTAEFLRMFITNPAYAAKQAPLTYGAFKGILNKTPEIASILEDAAKLSQTESGLNPTQVFTTMIAQPHVEGLERMSRSVARYGIVPTIKDYATQIYASVIRENVNFDRFAQALRDAGFQKEGKPLASLSYTKDPSNLYREMDGARQSAVSIIDRGVPLNLTDPFNAPRSPSLTQSLARAFNGSYSRIENPNDPLVKAFDGYLVARRAVGEWDLFEAGELRNQPVRASRAETEKAIKDFETQYPNFKQSGDDFFSFQRAYMQRLVDKDIWSQEMADKFLAKRSDHIPLYRDFGEDKAGGGPRNTKGGGLQFSDVHEFMGSTRDVVSPTRSVMQDVARRERRIAQNDVYIALDDLAVRAGELAGPFWEHVPNTEVRGTTVDVEAALRALGKEKGLSPAEVDMMVADLPATLGDDLTATVFRREETAPRGERIAFFYRGGKRQAVKMGDNELSKHFFDLMTGLSAPEKDLFLGAMQSVNAAFQAAITHAPRFLIGTLIRDNVTRMFFPRAQGVLGRVPFAQDVSGIYTMMFDRSFYRSYQEHGGIRGGAYSHAANEISHDTFKAAAEASGMMGRTLDELSAANTFSSKAAVVATIPGNAVRATGEYAGSLINRVRYKEGLPAQGWAVLTTPFKMVGDSLKLMELGETASRVGNAKLTYNYLKSQGLSDVEAMAGGMYEARDVLNYPSHGSMMTAAPRIFPFLQAAITGADRSARGLIAEPIMAASRAMERGGYANLDPKDKQILAAAWKNWTMIGAVSGVGAAVYLPYAQDTEFYKRASKYMRETYWLIQTGEDAEGRPVGLSIHKGYDVSAAIINTIENFSEEARKYDPINWLHVMSGLKEAVPRQFRSTTGLLEAAPGVRTAYEVQTGKKLGFEGGPARPLIPGNLEGLPPEQQALATTSTFARTVGRQMGVSPIVIDHVFNSSGTGVQDIRDLSSAVFDNNPLLTIKDALNRFFFGQIYRTSRGDAGAGQDLRDVMARNVGSYQKQSNAYKMSLEGGDTAEANSIYNRADDAAKTLMTLQSSVRFDPDARALHPLVRSQSIADNVYSMMRDLGKNQILIQDKRHQRGEPRKVIELSNEQTRQVHAQLNGLLSEETRNGLTIAGHPGYEDFGIIDTQPRIEILRQISPEVAKEYEARAKTAHVLPAQGVADQWAETKQRLLQDQRGARLADLIARAKASGRRPIAGAASPPP